MSTEPDQDHEDLAVAIWATENAPTSIQSEEDAKKVGQKMMKLETAIAAEDMELSIITQNIEQRKKELQRKLDFLHFQYDHDLEIWARKQRAGQKAKFVTLPYLKIQWRATPERVKIADMDRAVAWLKSHGEEEKIIVEESTTAEHILSVIKIAKECAADPYDESHWMPEDVAIAESLLDVTPPGENVTIGAGIIKATGKRSQLVQVVDVSHLKEPTPIGDPLTEVMHSIEATAAKTNPEDDDDIPW